MLGWMDGWEGEREKRRGRNDKQMGRGTEEYEAGEREEIFTHAA